MSLFLGISNDCKVICRSGNNNHPFCLTYYISASIRVDIGIFRDY